MTRLERGFQRHKTADKTGAMEDSLGALLSREGYSAGFRAEALAIKPGEKTDLLFDAAFRLLTDADFRYGRVRLNTAHVLDAIRFMEDILPRVSTEEILSHVSDAPEIIHKGLDVKKLKAASLLARMCNGLSLESAGAIWRVYCEVSPLRSPGYGPGTNQAANLFMKRIDRRVVDAGHERELVA